jgi:hypothetical protein
MIAACGVGHAISEIATVGANGLEKFDHGDHQLREIMSLAIREALQAEPRGASAKLAYELAAMGVCAVPQDDDQPSREVAGLELSDVLRVELKVKLEALAAGTRFSTRRSPHRASRHREARLFWG